MTPGIRRLVPQPVKAGLRRAAHRITQAAPLTPRFICPVCGHFGPFRTAEAPTGNRRHAICPGCGALERHRLQICVMRRLLEEHAPSGSVLHMAPESFVAAHLRKWFPHYTSADLDPSRAAMHADLRRLPFADHSFDLVYASHVLEHVDDDMAALAQIKRVLRPGGIAILPVPLLCDTTIEYPHPSPTEFYHVRAPGPDYFDRYRQVFKRVDIHWSRDFPAEHQLHVYEDRSHFPTPIAPYRASMPGLKHEDAVPVCWA